MHMRVYVRMHRPPASRRSRCKWHTANAVQHRRIPLVNDRVTERTLLSCRPCRTFLRPSVTVNGMLMMAQLFLQSRNASQESTASNKLAATPLCAAVVGAFDRISGRTGQVFTGADVVDGLSPEELRSIGAMTRVPILECVGRE